MKILVYVLIFAVSSIAQITYGQKASTQPIDVLPVFFVPKDGLPPTAEQMQKLSRHLRWAQGRYLDLLTGRGTFSIGKETSRIYKSMNSLSFYRKQPESSAPQIVSELLQDLGCDRYECLHVLLVIVMNKKDDFPAGGGRPLNGGYNNGGGVVVMSSFALDRQPNFQSTLEHELGHGFGLPHSDVYGQNMKSGLSIMTYNPKHHTSLFQPSSTPGILVPEDIRGLAINKRAFPTLEFDASDDVPPGYSLKPIINLGPMKIPGQQDYSQ